MDRILKEYKVMNSCIAVKDGGGNVMWAKRIEKIFMQLLGVILSIAFLFPIYVLAINSFKPLRDIYKKCY